MINNPIFQDVVLCLAAVAVTVAPACFEFLKDFLPAFSLGVNRRNAQARLINCNDVSSPWWYYYFP